MKSYCKLLLFLGCLVLTLAQTAPPCSSGKYDSSGKCTEDDPPTTPPPCSSGKYDESGKCTEEPTTPPDPCSSGKYDESGKCMEESDPTPPPSCSSGKYDKYGKCEEEVTPAPPRCCQCVTPEPCHLTCSPGYLKLIIDFAGVSAYGDLAVWQGYAGKNNLKATITFLFKPDFVRWAHAKKPTYYYLEGKGSYCLNVYDGPETIFSTSGSVKGGAEISAKLRYKQSSVSGMPFEAVELQVVDDDDTIVIDLKRNTKNGFGALENVLKDGILSVDKQFRLVADLDARLGGPKNKDVVFHSSKDVSNITLKGCGVKSPPMVCRPCNGGACPNIGKAQATVRTPKSGAKHQALVVKLDAYWRSCLNRTNSRKAEDFLISLISIRECTSKDQSSCPRQVLEFSQLHQTSGPASGIPTSLHPTVVFEGEVTVSGTGNKRAYLKVVVNLENDKLKIAFQLNKEKAKWKWVPSKNSMIFFSFKVAGQMAVYMLPKSPEKTTVKTVQFEIRDNIRLDLKPGYSSPYVVKTRLNLQFPLLVRGQYIKLDKKLIQKGKATLINLGFSHYHFYSGVLQYGNIVGNIEWQQFTPYAAELDAKNKAHLQVGVDDSESEAEESEAPSASSSLLDSSSSGQTEHQQSSATALRNWATLI